MISYLSIAEMKLLLIKPSLLQEEWKNTVECECYFFSINFRLTSNKTKYTPEQRIQKIKTENLMPEEWCDNLLNDLNLLYKHYRLSSTLLVGDILFYHPLNESETY